ncbi:AAA family ATPase [Sulfuriroseicoccus oceanibius]|uniref:SMC family ATPase n=1 Tax=Sulfuriroseicoccus oceanibius TaxID=2707525 RepID=A0A6B3L147_9BACT|nr:SMC family ATPase [Sulfuriroseicoccus oceanibius]QQL44114.1 SMC family ATPase [Sulfuriroseicoccus oceanibius]
MRILNVRLENYRTHEQLDVSLDQGISLVHGPNESGKSTVAEAVHHCLFLKPRGTSAVHTSMQRTGSSDLPVVELQLEIGGEHYTLTKKFGSSGATTLTKQGEAPLTSDAADTTLAELLHVDGALGGRGAEKQLQNRWAHLWVWQGSSNGSPAGAVSEQQKTLQKKLRSLSGDDLMISDTDNAVINRLQQVYDESYTPTGRLRTGSKLDKLQQSEQQLTALVAERQDALDQLSRAANSLTNATHDLTRHTARAEEVRKELGQITTKLQQAQAVSAALKEKQEQRETIESQLKDLQKSDQTIRALEKQQSAADSQVAPLKETLAGHQSDLESARAALQHAEDAVRSRSAAGENTKLLAEALDAHVNLLRCSAEVASLEKKQQRIQELEKDRKAASDTAAKLAIFSATAIKALRDAEREADAAQSRLEATSLKIDVLTASDAVAIDGDALAAGASATLDQPATLTVGDGTSIRLTPGGADDLNQAKTHARHTQEQLATMLKKLGVESVGDAEEQQEQRARAESSRNALAAELHALDAETVGRRMAELEEEITRLKSIRDRLTESLGEIKFEDSLDAARSALDTAKDTLQKQLAETKEATIAREQQQQQINRLSERIDAARKDFQQAEYAARDLKTKLSVLVEQFGAGDSRTQRILELEGKLDIARKAERTQQEALAELAPAQLETDHRRLTQAQENTGHAIDDANRRAIEARTRLETSGSSDPQRELAEAKAELERVTAQVEAETENHAAKSFLLEHLKEAQRKTSEALAKPLEDATSEFLEHLYGVGSKVRIQWNDDATAIDSIRIDRSSQGLGIYPFEELSHGTREQVALALRLAMAKVLAADHDGSLPIVLDDAFTHADRERIKKLQGVLYRGAESGLQIILLSCHPENYTGLAQREVGLGT